MTSRPVQRSRARQRARVIQLMEEALTLAGRTMRPGGSQLDEAIDLLREAATLAGERRQRAGRDTAETLLIDVNDALLYQEAARRMAVFAERVRALPKEGKR